MKFNAQFFRALWYDTVGKEDKAKEILSLDTLEEKKAYWLQVALFCAGVGLALAIPTYGISMALLLVSARKMQLYYTKKQ